MKTYLFLRQSSRVGISEATTCALSPDGCSPGRRAQEAPVRGLLVARLPYRADIGGFGFWRAIHA